MAVLAGDVKNYEKIGKNSEKVRNRKFLILKYFLLKNLYRHARAGLFSRYQNSEKVVFFQKQAPILRVERENFRCFFNFDLCKHRVKN